MSDIENVNQLNEPIQPTSKQRFVKCITGKYCKIIIGIICILILIIICGAIGIEVPILWKEYE